MDRPRAHRNPDRCPTYPDGLLREDIVSAFGRPKAEITRLPGICRQHHCDVMNERKPVSPEVAVRLAKMFGGDPLARARMQSAHDTWHAVRSVGVPGILEIAA